jgi:hypothetical protein
MPYYQRPTIQSQQHQNQRSQSQTNNNNTRRSTSVEEEGNKTTKTTSITLKRPSSSSSTTTTSMKATSSTEEKKHHGTISSSSSPKSSSSSPPPTPDASAMALLALFHAKAHHVVSLCQVVDVRRRGYVYLDKMIEVLQTISPQSSAEDLRSMLTKYFAHQKNNFFVVDYSEFVSILSKMPNKNNNNNQNKSSSPSTTKNKKNIVERNQNRDEEEFEAEIVEQRQTKYESELLSPAQQHLFGISPSLNRLEQQQYQKNQKESEISPSSRSPSSPSPPSAPSAVSPATKQRQHQDAAATETLRQMLRAELDRISDGNPQIFIDYILDASASSKREEQHRTREVWMVRTGELERALSALYAHKARMQTSSSSSSTSPSSSSPSSFKSNNVFAMPPEWVVTRARKIAQFPLLVLAANNNKNNNSTSLLSSSSLSAQRLKEFKKSTKTWLMSHPEIHPEEWCDVSFLLESIYLSD